MHRPSTGLVISLALSLALFSPGCRPQFDQPIEINNSYSVLPVIDQGTVNWMGHWLAEAEREQLVREVASEFEFENPGIEVNLQFHQEIIGVRRLL